MPSKLFSEKTTTTTNSNQSTSFDFTENAASQYKNSMNSTEEGSPSCSTEFASDAKLLFNNAILKVEKDNRITKWLDEIESVKNKS